MATVVVYATEPAVRDQVRMAIGRSPAAGVEDVEYVLTDDVTRVVALVDDGEADLLVLDGEAWPTGGLGLCRRLKNEVSDCPPAVVLIGRRDDRWLAEWSQADAVLMHPIDSNDLTRSAVRLLTSPVVASSVADKE